jgi:hypothetical protein
VTAKTLSGVLLISDRSLSWFDTGMKRAEGKFNSGGKSARRIRIVVQASSEGKWRIPLKVSAVSPMRNIPRSFVTKILLERNIQLRLVRVLQRPAEQLGFYIA